MAGNALDTVLRNPHLPSLPTVAMQILELTRSPTVNMQEIARVIENDQALSVKVIRTVNSSYYGLSQPCTTIRQAIVYLGLNAVKTLVLGFSLVEWLDDGDGDHIGFDYVDYWRRALYSAAAAREIATITGNVDPEEVFLAAMIQDMGMIALYRAYKDLYLQIIDMTSGCHAKLVNLERQSFRTDHAEVGAAVAEHWKMPRQIVESIRYHHAADSAPLDMKQHLRTLELAQQGAVLASEANRRSAREDFDRLAREHFACNRQQIRHLIQTMTESAEELADLLALSTGNLPEASNLLAEAESQQIQHQAIALRESELLRRSGHNTVDTQQQMFDPVTHLPASASFWKSLRQSFDDAFRDHQHLAVILCRLQLNVVDFSSDDADETRARVLIECARLLEQVAGGSCIVHRYDHDRFALIVPAADRRKAAARADQLRRSIETELPARVTVAENNEVSGSKIMSFGVAALEPDTRDILTNPELLAGYADHALQMADRATDKAVRVFVPSNMRIQAA